MFLLFLSVFLSSDARLMVGAVAVPRSAPRGLATPPSQPQAAAHCLPIAHPQPRHLPTARSWAVDGGQRGSLTPTALSPPATSDLGHGANPTRGQTGVHTHVTPFEPVNHILISSSRRSSSDCQKRWLYLRGWRSQQTALQVGPVQQAALWVGLYNKQPCNSGLCD